MPKTGDGDLWPTTDDDTTSPGSKDAETHELPVPDQQEQSKAEPSPEAVAEPEPEPDQPTEPEPKRDEPHGKPEQQITQPVRWPIADLKRQVTGDRPPAWPTVEGGTGENQKSTALAFTKAEDPGPTPEEQKAPTSIMRPVQRKPPAEEAPKAAEGTEPPTKPAAEKPAGKPAEKPAEKPADKSAEKPADKLADKPAEKPAEKPVERPVARSAETRADQLAEKLAEKSADNPAEKLTDRPTENLADKPAGEADKQVEPAEKAEDRLAGKQAEKSADMPAESFADRPADKAADRPAGKADKQVEPAEGAAGKSAEKAADRPAESWADKQVEPADSSARKPEDRFAGKSAEKAADRPTESWTDKQVDPADRSAGKPDDQPAGNPAAQLADKPAQKPADKPAERLADKPRDLPAAPAPAEKPTAPPATEPHAEKPAEKPAEPARKPAEDPARKPAAEWPAWQPAEEPAQKPAWQFKADPAQQPGRQPTAAKPDPEHKPAPAKNLWPSEPDTGARKAPGQKDTRPEDAPTNFMRPVPPPHLRRTQPDKRQENAPTSFLRPDSRRPEPPVPNFIRPTPNRDDATGLIPRDAAGAPVFSRPENPTAFIRRDNLTRNADSATVNLSRPEKDQKDEWPPPEPPRAAPKRVGPEPEPDAEPAEKKRRKPLLIAAIALVAVVAVAAGVVFGVPGLSDKLGITGEDPVAIDPPPGPISYQPSLHGPDAAAAGPSKSGVEQALAGPMADPALGNVNGVVIDPATGETLYEKNPDGPTTPASTGKILTAATALLSLDPTEQLVTKVVEGDQPGEVIIVGGGDPTISSLPVGQESIYPGAAHLSELVDQVKASGAQVQTVYIDQSRYAAPGLAPSWLTADIAAGFIAPIVPAMLDGDRQTDPAENYSPRTTDPGRTLVDEFASRMGASPAASIEKKAPENAKVLGEIRSAPITQLVDNMLNRSENTLADVLAHEVAVKAGEEPNFDGASKAMLDVLRQNQFNVDGVVLRDGSGMSEENKMTARLLAEVLAVAASPDGKDPRTAKLRPLLGGLPVAGGSGTLADRYDAAAAAEGKGWVRAKTGSLTGINSLAGIVLDKDNRPLVFAFLTSGSVATTARPALDAVSATLRGCGCQ